MTKCWSTGRPIDFVYKKKSDRYELERYKSDTHLLHKIRSGKGDREIYKIGYNLNPDMIFGGTYPKEIEQDFFTGENDIIFARAAIFIYFIEVGRNPQIEDKFYEKYEQIFSEAIEEFNLKAKTIEVKVLTLGGIEKAFRGDLNKDLFMVQLSGIVVFSYLILNLGSCSPVHMRATIALGGLFSIILSYLMGQGVSGLLGYEKAAVHSLLAFLLIGIGADDMFVICNAMDQTSLNDPLEKRFKEAMSKSGPSIVITSITNACSFLAGSVTPTSAMNSFCIYAALSISFLFFTCLTVFSCFMVWDTKRQIKRKGDCCGLCFCREDSFFCCRAKFLTPEQKIFSGLI